MNLYFFLLIFCMWIWAVNYFVCMISLEAFLHLDSVIFLNSLQISFSKFSDFPFSYSISSSFSSVCFVNITRTDEYVKEVGNSDHNHIVYVHQFFILSIFTLIFNSFFSFLMMAHFLYWELE